MPIIPSISQRHMSLPSNASTAHEENLAPFTYSRLNDRSGTPLANRGTDTLRNLDKMGECTTNAVAAA